MAELRIDLTSTPVTCNIVGLGKQTDGIKFIRLDSGCGYIDGVFKKAANSDALVVLFPAALPLSALKMGQFPYIPRWQWIDKIPANVWCFEESLARKYNLAAAWFHERDHFYADTIAQVIKEIAFALRIKDCRITLMGSSLGGFGALMVAPTIPGSRVIADIAQTDLMTYQFKTAIMNLCVKIHATNDLAAVNKAHRDRFSVIERFKAIGRIPDMTILHELTDEPNGRQQIYSFLTDLAELRKTENHSFRMEAIIRNTGQGHVALAGVEMLPLLYRVAEI